MFKAITHHQIWVLDQDEALDFYVGKLGFEVNTDVALEHMRWLTVNVPGQPERQLVLMLPAPPAVDAEAVEAVRDLVAKGNGGGMPILTTDDCRGDYERLAAQGVVRRAGRQGSRVHRGADRTLLRDRLRAPRPLRQPHPHDAAGAPAGHPAVGLGTRVVDWMRLRTSRRATGRVVRS